jgi:hypothetical protein
MITDALYRECIQYIQSSESQRSFYHQTLRMLIISSVFRRTEHEYELTLLFDVIHNMLDSCGFKSFTSDDIETNWIKQFNTTEKWKICWLYGRIHLVLSEHNNTLNSNLKILNDFLYDKLFSFLTNIETDSFQDSPLRCWSLGYVLISSRYLHKTQSETNMLEKMLKNSFSKNCKDISEANNWNSDQAWCFVMTIYSLSEANVEDSYSFLSSVKNNFELLLTLKKCIPVDDFRAWGISLVMRALKSMNRNELFEESKSLQEQCISESPNIADKLISSLL